MVDDGALFARLDESYWIDTGTPTTYLAAQFDILDGSRPSVLVPEHHDAASHVALGPGARLSGAAMAPVLIGPGAIVEEGALVERCVLGAGVLVRRGAVVRDSLVLEGARSSARAYASRTRSSEGAR